MSRFSTWGRREYRPTTRIVVTLLAGVFFVILLPILLAVVCPSLDEILGLNGFTPRAMTCVLGAILMAIGVLLTQGRGTPLPMMPTQGLLTEGPFRYCRNPMTLGTFLAYLGLSLAVGNAVGIALVLGLTSMLVIYLKRIEEHELAERFGEPYGADRREVPFIVPRRPVSCQRSDG